MRNQSKVLRAPNQRNPVVLGLLQRIVVAAAGRHRRKTQPTRQEEGKDLAQRVREIGEW